MTTNFKKTLMAGVLVLFCNQSLFAQEAANDVAKPTDATEPEAEQSSELDAATARENPVSSVPYESGHVGEPTCEDRWSNFLPILGKPACERGYVLPRPFGLSLGYMHQDQPFDVGGIYFNGIDLKTLGVVVVDEVQNEETTYTLRADVWVLPFWNVYGILGKTDGQAVGPLKIDLAPIFPTICNLPGKDCSTDTQFKLDYDADVRGYGTTIAGGYKDFFGMIDINWTTADLDISLTDAKATVISSRIGWNGKIGVFTGVLWVGVMYQDIAQTLDLPLGIIEDTDLADLGLPLDIAGFNGLVSIEQSTQAAYNYTVGGQWDFNRSFSLLAEFGFGERKSQMLNITYRF